MKTKLRAQVFTATENELSNFISYCVQKYLTNISAKHFWLVLIFTFRIIPEQFFRKAPLGGYFKKKHRGILENKSYHRWRRYLQGLTQKIENIS